MSFNRGEVPQEWRINYFALLSRAEQQARLDLYHRCLTNILNQTSDSQRCLIELFEAGVLEIAENTQLALDTDMPAVFRVTFRAVVRDQAISVGVGNRRELPVTLLVYPQLAGDKHMTFIVNFADENDLANYTDCMQQLGIPDARSYVLEDALALYCNINYQRILAGPAEHYRLAQADDLQQ